MSVAANYVRLSPTTLARWREQPGLFDAICAQQLPDAEHLDLDRAWDGLSWLLSTAKRQQKAADLSEDDDTPAPGAPDTIWNIIEGVKAPTEPLLDFGYGPARVLDTTAVAQGCKALDSVIQHDLRSAFDPETMDDHEVSPQIWLREGRGALDEYLMPYFERLRAFIRRARDAKQPVVIFFG